MGDPSYFRKHGVQEEIVCNFNTGLVGFKTLGKELPILTFDFSLEEKIMNFRSSIFLSTIIHLLLVGGFLFFGHASLGNLSSVQLHLSKGGIPNLRFSIPSNLGNGLPASDQKREAGTEEFEVQKFKNEMHFPSEALEQRLESDCTWEVEIGRAGEARKVTTIHPCRYQIFESQFRKSIYRWKFQLKEGTILTIPVSFRIETND